MGEKMIQYENIQNILNVPIFQKTVSLVFGKWVLQWQPVGTCVFGFQVSIKDSMHLY